MRQKLEFGVLHLFEIIQFWLLRNWIIIPLCPNWVTPKSEKVLWKAEQCTNSLKDVRALTPRTCEYVILHGKRCDYSHRPQNGEIILDYIGGLILITWVRKKDATGEGSERSRGEGFNLLLLVENGDSDHKPRNSSLYKLEIALGL